MSKYKTVYTEVEVDVNIEDFDTEDLVEELENRGYKYNEQGVDADAMRELLTKIWQNRREGRAYDQELDQLIYGVLGKIV